MAFATRSRSTLYGRIGGIAIGSFLALSAAAQVIESTTPLPGTVPHQPPLSRPPHHPHPHIIVPPVRPMPRPDLVRISSVVAGVNIENQIGTTAIEMTIANPTGTPQEAQILLPVPDGVTVRSLEYDGAGSESQAEVLTREEARRIYDSIVASMRDPALVEFAGYNLIRTSVFPIPAGGAQRVKLTYEQVLSVDGDRVDYWLPRSEANASPNVPWTLNARIRSKHPVSTVYSPSHELAITRNGPGDLSINVINSPLGNAGSFRMSWLVQREKSDGVSGTLIAYPDPGMGPDGGGYFLLLGGMPAEQPVKNTRIKREVVIVIDRSGSMRGEKIAQTRAAATQIVDGLEDGEAFNIIDYSDSISSFAEKPVIKDAAKAAEARRYIASFQAGGGTNIQDALLEALRPEPMKGMMPLVLFMTDGLPTVGERNEVKIREAVKAANKIGRRIFTFGVGFDVNSPLLSGIAKTTRATTTFVQPQEDVEVKVSQVFKRLSGPVLASPRLVALGADGKPSSRVVRELQPGELPDMFEGDQLVVLGQYFGDAPITFRIEGEFRGVNRSFDMRFDMKEATTRHGYVPRLWATRKIAALIEEIRQAGAEGHGAIPDSRMKELTDEIVRLSTRFGVLTEYTSFLARDGTDFSVPGRQAMVTGTMMQLRARAVEGRAGAGGVSQEENLRKMTFAVNDAAGQAAKPAAEQFANCWYDDKMQLVTITNVQQVADQTLFCRNNRWIDARILDKEQEKPDREVIFASAEYLAIMNDLAKEGRQAMLANDGETYFLYKSQRVLVRMP